LNREQITHAELFEALRQEGCTSVTRVRYTVLENDGDITAGLRAGRRRWASPLVACRTDGG
jgi:uncharacterized membrane protein YcaP (DUF421 family)